MLFNENDDAFLRHSSMFIDGTAQCANCKRVTYFIRIRCQLNQLFSDAASVIDKINEPTRARG